MKWIYMKQIYRKKNVKDGNENRKMSAQSSKRGNHLKPVLAIAVFLSCCLVGGLLARYLYQTVTDPGQVTSEYFYFTADLLGDTKMVQSDGTQEEGYSFDESSTEGTWYLYGGSKHDIKIQIQNYYDELRYTNEDITFETSLLAKKADGTEISIAGAENSSGPKLAVESSDVSDKGAYTLTGKQESSIAVTLTVPSNSSWKYEENTVLTVKLSSTAPYKKTLTLNFILYAKEAALRYLVKDSVGSPYAELVIMTNVENSGSTEQSVQPYIIWPQSLAIDNTNSLTFTYKNGTFTQQAGMEARNMQISEPFATGRSESIYFFKSDPSDNFSKKETVAIPQDNKYTIDLTK